MIFFIFSSPKAHGDDKWFDTIKITQMGEVITLKSYPKGWVELQTELLPGRIFYNSSSQVMLYRDKVYQDTLYKLTAPMDGTNAEEAKLKKVGEGPIVAGFRTTNWQVEVNRKFCAQVFTSKTMASNVQLNLADMARINRYLGVLQGAEMRSNPCVFYKVNSALALVAGFPLLVSGPDGTTEVIDIETLPAAGKKPELPEFITKLPTKAVDKTIQEHLMKNNLSDEYRKMLKQAPAELSDDMRSKLLKQLSQIQENN